jgi:WhiB family redox-sensing transcriptional regulator
MTDLPSRQIHPLDLTRPDWAKQAACHGMTHLFFGETVRDANQARKICATCPVKQQCGQYAIDGHENFGTWGGMTVNERLRASQRERAWKHGTYSGYDRHRNAGETPCHACLEAVRKRSREYQRRRRAQQHD